MLWPRRSATTRSECSKQARNAPGCSTSATARHIPSTTVLAEPEARLEAGRQESRREGVTTLLCRHKAAVVGRCCELAQRHSTPIVVAAADRTRAGLVPAQDAALNWAPRAPAPHVSSRTAEAGLLPNQAAELLLVRRFSPASSLLAKGSTIGLYGPGATAPQGALPSGAPRRRAARALTRTLVPAQGALTSHSTSGSFCR